jgi:hypothetical protein
MVTAIILGKTVVVQQPASAAATAFALTATVLKGAQLEIEKNGGRKIAGAWQKQARGKFVRVLDRLDFSCASTAQQILW